MLGSRNFSGSDLKEERLTPLEWLRFGPWLAQVVVVRRCNLTCGYCTEYDRTSEPVSFDLLAARLDNLARMRTWAVCLTGGEPTLHPKLAELVARMRLLGFKRRQLITNGTLLTSDLIDALNQAGLTDLQISVDGVSPNDVTVKTLRPLRKRLEMLADRARFRVVMSAVIGTSPAEETVEVLRFAIDHGFSPRVLLRHDERGQVHLSPEELAAYAEARRLLGARGREARDYRGQIADSEEAPFKCRSGSRYLYVDEFGRVNWCAQTRDAFSKDLRAYSYADLKKQFQTVKTCSVGCTIGCARTASAFDEFRPQPTVA